MSVIITNNRQASNGSSPGDTRLHRRVIQVGRSTHRFHDGDMEFELLMYCEGEFVFPLVVGCSPTLRNDNQELRNLPLVEIDVGRSLELRRDVEGIAVPPNPAVRARIETSVVAALTTAASRSHAEGGVSTGAPTGGVRFVGAWSTAAAAPARNSGDTAKSRVTLQPLRDAWRRMIASAAALPVSRVNRGASAARTEMGGAA